jgi:hypothetical protein
MERPEGIPQNLQQSQIGYIFGTTLLSTAYHLFRPNPSAGEATRGYLHGGLILDFVGQLGPVPKVRLFLLDLALLLLELLLAQVVASKRHWEDRYQGYTRKPTTSRDSAATDEVTLERQSAEEQGMTTTESHIDRPVFEKDSYDIDRLDSGQETLGPFWILDLITESHQAHRLPSHQPTSRLSSLLSTDLRRRQYSLNLSFGS